VRSNANQDDVHEEKSLVGTEVTILPDTQAVGRVLSEESIDGLNLVEKNQPEAVQCHQNWNLLEE
jgi:hypothetical protein